MKALIKKELYLIKFQVLISFVMCLCFFIAFLAFKLEASLFPNFMSGLGMSVAISSFSFDEASKFANFSLSMPYGIKKLVQIKYLLSLSTLFVFYLLGLCFLAFSQPSYFENSFEVLQTTLGTFTIMSAIFYVLIPVMFKLGVSRMAYGITGAMGVASALIYLFYQLPIWLPKEIANLVMAICVCSVLIGGLLTSYFVSIKVLKNR